MSNHDDPPQIRSFANEGMAKAWMAQTLDEEQEFCVDNERFAFLDDAAGMAVYEAQMKDGCCGFMDEEIIVDGRQAKIGCNYGH